MNIKVKLEQGAKMPCYAHDDDAGADVFVLEDTIVPAHDHKDVRTGVKVELPLGLYIRMASKSGLMVKAGLTCDGTIDAGYRGEIMAVMFNHSDEDYYFRAGDKVAQMIVSPYIHADFEQVDSLEDTERGDGGFGSTGR